MERVTTTIPEVSRLAAGVRPGVKGASSLRRPILFALACVAPVVAAIWLVPGFHTQDGPAHLYNSEILLDLVRRGEESKFAETFEARWQPTPNWAGHLLPMALMLGVEPAVAGRLMATITLVGVLAATLWLRRRVAGPRHFMTAALAASIISINFLWLLGFWGFLLGTALCFVTWGVAWNPHAAERGRWGWRFALPISGLLLLGYFCHPVSLAVCVFGLILIAAFQADEGRSERLGWTFASCVPLIPLFIWYLLVMRHAGGFRPIYENLKHVTSPASWASQLGWVEPISLSSKVALPFTRSRSAAFFLLSPLLGIGIGLYLTCLSRWFGAKKMSPLSLRMMGKSVPEQRAKNYQWLWWTLASLLLFGGLVVPDTVGEAHGNYLPQRVVLIGLLVCVVAFDASRATHAARRCAWASNVALGLALVVQVAFVWDYAIHSSRVVGGMLTEASPHVGRDQKIAGLMIDLRGPFRANPLMHADALFGLGSGNVVWSNYELSHYYFPLRVKQGVSHPSSAAFENVAKWDGKADVSNRLKEWTSLLGAHHQHIDRLVIRGFDESLDTATRIWFDVDHENELSRVRVWKRREGNDGPLNASPQAESGGIPTLVGRE
jgi:hypothetical protein